MPEDFPRLLVATEFAPNSSGGGAAIVRQMLKSWPVEKLFWWSCLPEQDKRFGQQTAAHALASIPQKFYPHRRWIRHKSWLMENLWVPYATRHLRRTMAEVRPEVIWTIPHAWSIPPLEKVLPGSGIGFHVSVHDYPDLKPQVESLGANRCGRWLKSLEHIYAGAASRDAICQPMIDDLQLRTGRAGTVVRAGLEGEDFEKLDTPPAGSEDQIRIAYAGTIHVEDVFALFVVALGKIRAQLPRPVSLEFFGNHAFHAFPWFDASWMKEHGNLPVQPLNEELWKCTWGFSPMAMADEDPSYNRFSFPTKFVSYLTAGLPVFSLGQPESSIMKMAAEYETGVCITTKDEAALSAQLLAAMSVPQPQSKYFPGIRRCAQNEFDARGMRAALYECLKKCASVQRRV